MRIPSLDGVRALSICLVMIGHVAGTRGAPDLSWVHAFGDLGNLGVRIFFVISGFLITTLLYREMEHTGRISLVGFFRRRALRILPPFLVYVGVIAGTTALGLLSVEPADFLSALTFTANYDATRSWPLGHLWSLAVEEQFYLLWPLLLVAFGLSRASWLAGAALLIAPAARVGVYLFAPEWRWSVGEAFPTIMDALASGCLLAVVHERFAGNSRYLRFLGSNFVLAAPVFVLLLNALMPYVSFSYTVGQTLLNTLIAVLVHRVVLFSHSPIARVLNAKSIVYLGVLSYSLYLWQQPFLDRSSDSVVTVFPLNVAFALGAAIFSYHFVERPTLTLRRRLDAAVATQFERSREAEHTPGLSVTVPAVDV